ncbi:MAG: hypothetical protein VX829_11500 [Pseudomonadota bacterium]|uniref:hypothetical protein n=1 Tax=Methylophaga sp. TaxID=2024840 RepID=UPI002ECBA6BB|nr:hypothetical protein [Pseudomonadota bacterium]
MKLIISQYLNSLNERGELDAILPDLLSQLGFTVYSRPGRGTSQDGVDVAAVGRLNHDKDKVYLFSIKAGDLTRSTWNGSTNQSLRPSLDEILDAYINNRIPIEHKDKEIVICICIGGVIQEPVSANVEGYIQKNTTEKITFQTWNGDKLAALIEANFLREELLPDFARGYLRKSLALLDEPESSHRHFISLLSTLSSEDDIKPKKKLMSLRQLHICTWILFSWARDANNLESAYLSAESSLLFAWDLIKGTGEKKDKISQELHFTFITVLNAYMHITSEYLARVVLPHVDKLQALSVAVEGQNDVDVTLKMYDIMGRLALYGLWAKFYLQAPGDSDEPDSSLNHVFECGESLKKLINNNPSLLIPLKDDHAIEIFLALLLLSSNSNNFEYLSEWLSEMIGRIDFTLRAKGRYPTIQNSYVELLDHPISDDDYFKDSTMGSVLYPVLALWSVHIRKFEYYEQIQKFHRDVIPHCNSQYWYPDEISEMHIYKNSEIHGGALGHLIKDQEASSFYKQIFDECENSDGYESLSCIKNELWPIVLIACRHYRLPVPVQVMRDLLEIEK